MSGVGQREIKTQQRVIAFLCDALGHAYLGDWKNRETNDDIDAWGRGIQRILAACREAGTPEPRIEVD